MTQYKYNISFVYDGEILVNKLCRDYYQKQDRFIIVEHPKLIDFYDPNRMSNIVISEVKE